MVVGLCHVDMLFHLYDVLQVCKHVCIAVVHTEVLSSKGAERHVCLWTTFQTCWHDFSRGVILPLVLVTSAHLNLAWEEYRQGEPVPRLLLAARELNLMHLCGWYGLCIY